MAYTETTTQSWGSRLGDSIKGIVIGLILFLVAFPLLFWNEGNSVKVAQALEEGRGATVEVEDITKINPEMNGKLVHMCGDATTEDVLKDSEFCIDHNGIMLRRSVQYYQWVEHSRSEKKKNMGGSETTVTTYTYEKKWCDRPESSANFKEAGHNNTVFFNEADDQEQRAENVKFGAFKFSSGMINKIGNEKTYSLGEYKVPEKLKGRARVADKYLYIGRPVQGAVSAPAAVGFGQQGALAAHDAARNAAANAQQTAPVDVERTKLEIAQLNLQVQQQQLVQKDPAATAEQKQAAELAIVRLQVDIQQKELLIKQAEAAKLAAAQAKPAETPAVQQAKLELERQRLNLKQLQLTLQNPNVPAEQRQTIENSVKQMELAIQQAELNVKQAELAAQAAAPQPQPAAQPQPAVQQVAQQPIMEAETCSVDPSNPQVGDVRITWEAIGPKEAVSIVYVQSGDTFTPYHAKSNRDVALLGMGTQTADDLFTTAERNNVIFTWLLRVAGWFLMFIGLSMIFKPLSVLGDVVPFIGTLIGGASSAAAAVLALILSLITIAIAWIWYRPLLGITILVLAAALIVWLIKRNRQAKEAKAAAEQV